VSAFLRLGNLEAAYHIFSYMKKELNWGCMSQQHWMHINYSVFNDFADWLSFYGEPGIISAFVDVNHGGNVVTRHSHSGILIYVQNAPIIWFSKMTKYG
jgi:predicted AlkP superfamily pyrophosphatase or phosphodiesterase